MKMHKSLTAAVIVEAAQRTMFGLDNVGFCIECGAEHECEPDARRYVCDDCGKSAVFGAEELLISGGGVE